jgi:hypothetical protein
VTTALAHRTVATTRYAPPAKGVLGRIRNLRTHSPGRLQLILAMLLTLGLLTGLVAGLTAHSAAAGTTGLGERAQPLLVEAETIYSKLADADTTAAQAFLAGGLEPVALTRRYDDDLNQAGAALTGAAHLVPEDSDAARASRSPPAWRGTRGWSPPPAPPTARACRSARRISPPPPSSTGTPCSRRRRRCSAALPAS